MTQRLERAQGEAVEWRDVVGYAGLYDVSSQGSIRSYRTPGSFAVSGRPTVMVPYTTPGGYKRVSLTGADGRCIGRTVHSVVAEAFIGPRPHLHQVNHIDGSKENNRADNLEYVTCLENHRHAARVGLKARGEAHGAAKLTSADVGLIREALAAGEAVASVARRFGVAWSTIRWIKIGKTWRCAP